MFDQEALFTLSKSNYESRQETKGKRCRLFEETLRHIYKRIRPELVSASTSGVYEAAIEGLESRNPPALILLRECAHDPQREQAPSSADNASQQQQVLSELVQLRQAYEQLVQRQERSDELLKKLESDLAREKSVRLERELGTEPQRKVIREAGQKALSEIRSKFEILKRDVSRLLVEFGKVDDMDLYYCNRYETRCDSLRPIKWGVGSFAILMKERLEEALKHRGALKGEQEQNDYQYVAIKEGFSKLETELEYFQQILSDSSHSNLMTRSEIVQSFNARLENIDLGLKELLDVTWNYIGQ